MGSTGGQIVYSQYVCTRGGKYRYVIINSIDRTVTDIDEHEFAQHFHSKN